MAHLVKEPANVLGIGGGAILAGGGTAVVQSTVAFGANVGARLLPIGMTTAYFGQQIMKWGTGDASALARVGTVTLQELQASGITRQMAQSWRDFYSYALPLRTMARTDIDSDSDRQGQEG